MLRYVFDNTFQLTRHVHQKEGAALLFFPRLSGKHRTGERALLEMQLRDDQQRVVLRAVIHSRVEGNRPGIWLQFSDLLIKAIESNAAVIRRRRHPRLGSDLMVELRDPDASARIARMVDVSADGARLTSAPGLHPGQAVEVHLISPMPDVPRAVGMASVVRVMSGEAGLRFETDAAPRVRKLVGGIEAQWRSAVTVEHAAGCCQRPELDEPPAPRIRQQKVIP